jgi:cell division protein FtsW/undecaprenyldiphospho-muramoylpentapeptide beta-N-acetylglucosaminyltransferase
MSGKCGAAAIRLSTMHVVVDLDEPAPGQAGRARPVRQSIGRLRAGVGSWRALLDRPLTSYYLILGFTSLLLGLGLVMVQSTASVYDLSQQLSPYSDLEKQLLGCALGLPAMWIMARSSPKLFRALAYPLLAISVVGLCLTLIHGVGVSANGAARWISIGGQPVQPSELAKLALVLWGADLLARKEKLGQLTDWRHLLVPLMPGTCVLCLLVMTGDDLGTTFVLLIIFLALLWVIGTPGRVYAALLILMALAMVLMIISAPYRFDRLIDFLHPQGGPTGPDQQGIQGIRSIASGGVFGVGLGASRGKWGYVPESTSDFIFAIIGEELGLLGTMCVITLYGGLAFAGLRVARRVPDLFAQLAATAITAWIVLQAVVNIGAVIGVLPITGVPLPLVSAGLSSLLVTLVALGMLMAFARMEPGAREALAARGPGWPVRVLSWLGLAKRRNLPGWGPIMRVMLAGGGSAGHIEPALALADALRRADPGTEITCLGTERGLETRLIPLRGYPLELIPAVPLPRSLTPKLLTVPGRLAGAVSAAAAALDRTGAEVLVGFGGYVATPAYLAARRRKVPIIVHEANPKAGLANKLGARFTTHVFTGHPDTEIRNGKYLGIPIRREIAELDRLAAGDKARAHFGLRTDLPVLLVTGGSQGARSLNAAVFGAAGDLRAASIQVLHIIGPRNGVDAPVTAGPVPYVATSYIDRMDLAYAAADFALCRAGAMTCAELTAVGLPAAYVPLPIGNGEQRLNALPIVQHGGGMLVPDDELTADWIRDKLLPVLVNIDQVADMSAAAASLGRGDADRWLAQAVTDIVLKERAGGENRAAGPRHAG